MSTESEIEAGNTVLRRFEERGNVQFVGVRIRRLNHIAARPPQQCRTEELHVNNDLDEATTAHWHGADVRT